MNVNIELKRNFVNAYNRMQDDYGEEIANINGFSAGQCKRRSERYRHAYKRNAKTPSEAFGVQ